MLLSQIPDSSAISVPIADILRMVRNSRQCFFAFSVPYAIILIMVRKSRQSFYAFSVPYASILQMVRNSWQSLSSFSVPYANILQSVRNSCKNRSTTIYFIITKNTTTFSDYFESNFTSKQIVPNCLEHCEIGLNKIGFNLTNLGFKEFMPLES